MRKLILFVTLLLIYQQFIVYQYGQEITPKTIVYLRTVMPKVYSGTFISSTYSPASDTFNDEPYGAACKLVTCNYADDGRFGTNATQYNYPWAYTTLFIYTLAPFKPQKQGSVVPFNPMVNPRIAPN